MDDVKKGDGCEYQKHAPAKIQKLPDEVLDAILHLQKCYQIDGPNPDSYGLDVPF